MTNLNADVDDGLDGDDDLLVTPPNATQTPPVVFNLIASNTRNVEADSTEAQLFKEVIVPGELPDIQGKITVIEDAQQKIFDIKAIEETLLGQKSISQEEVRMIDAVVGNFLTDHVKCNHFSIKPSLANYNMTLGFLKKSIAQEEINLDEQLTSFSTETLKNLYLVEMKCIRDSLQDTLIDRFKKQLWFFRTEFESVFKNIKEPRNTVFPSGDGFINIALVPVSFLNNENIQYSEIPGNDVDIRPFKEAVKTVNDLVKVFELICFINQTLTSDEVGMPESSQVTEIIQSSHNFSLQTLVDFYNSDELESNIEKLLFQFNTLYGQLADSMNRGNDQKTVLMASPVIFNQYQKELVECLDESKYINTVFMGLLTLNHAMYSVFHYLKKYI